MDPAEIVRSLLMYVVGPLWLAAGLADYFCHRAARIEHSSGAGESLLHMAGVAQMATAALAVLFLEINALVLTVLLVCLVLHEATVYWDIRYASATRSIGAIEQHVHSFLEVLPFTGLLLIAALHGDQFLALVGQGAADFSLTPKRVPLPPAYLAAFLTGAVLFSVLPFAEEMARCLAAAKARRNASPSPIAAARPR
jgi:hypothetical protein